MNLFASAPDWALWILVALLAAAAIQDAIQLRISNLITLAVFVLGLVAAAFGDWNLALWQNLAMFAAVLGVGMMLFTRNVLGGGDVKLFAAVAIWINFATALWWLAAILLSGGALALLVLLLRTILPPHLTSRAKALHKASGIPYGIAIAVGTCLVIAAVPDARRSVLVTEIAPLPEVQRQAR